MKLKLVPLNPNWVKYKDLPGWKSKADGKSFDICNPEGNFIGIYSPTFKTASLHINDNIEHKSECKTLHKAIQWMYIKTLEPISVKPK